MKLDFDITTAEYAVIRSILERLLPPEAKVWVFGSRAKGTARFNSDLDLAIESKAALAQSQIFALKEAFDDAPLSFRVDVVDHAQVDGGFRNIIDGHRISFPIPKTRLKHLRFPEFLEEWEEKTVGSLVHSLDAGVSVNSGDRPAKGIEKGVLKTSCVTLGVFDEQENKIVDDEIEIARLKEPVQANSIIISRMNTPALVGANAFVPIDFPNLFLPDRLWAAKMKATASPKWTALLLAHHRTRDRLSERATGTSGSMKNLSKSDVLSLPIFAPTLAEQKKIAAFLGVVDAKIAGLRAKVEGLETYKRGLMQALFSQTLRFTKPDGTAYPDWEEKRLGEVCNIDWGNTSTTKASYDEFGEFLAVSASGGDGRIAFYEHEAFTPVLSAIGALCGKMFLPTERFTAIKNTIVFTHATNSFFLYYALLNFSFPIQGAGQPFIGKKDLEKSKIFFPHPEEQQKIADSLSAMDAKIQAASAQVSHMETFKKGLLQQMFV
jgi:type I restriction enzyme, S subunit